MRSAVIEAIFGVKSEFVRTPKYRVEAGAKGDRGDWAKKKYHKSAGWMPFVEVVLGIYFAGTVVYASRTKTTPRFRSCCCSCGATSTPA